VAGQAGALRPAAHCARPDPRLCAGQLARERCPGTHAKRECLRRADLASRAGGARAPGAKASAPPQSPHVTTRIGFIAPILNFIFETRTAYFASVRKRYNCFGTRFHKFRHLFHYLVTTYSTRARKCRLRCKTASSKKSENTQQIWFGKPAHGACSAWCQEGQTPASGRAVCAVPASAGRLGVEGTTEEMGAGACTQTPGAPAAGRSAAATRQLDKCALPHGDSAVPLMAPLTPSLKSTINTSSSTEVVTGASSRTPSGQPGGAVGRPARCRAWRRRTICCGGHGDAVPSVAVPSAACAPFSGWPSFETRHDTSGAILLLWDSRKAKVP
jgi:hypothetical protein